MRIARKSGDTHGHDLQSTFMSVLSFKDHDFRNEVSSGLCIHGSAGMFFNFTTFIDRSDVRAEGMIHPGSVKEANVFEVAIGTFYFNSWDEVRSGDNTVKIISTCQYGFEVHYYNTDLQTGNTRRVGVFRPDGAETYMGTFIQRNKGTHAGKMTWKDMASA